MKSKTLIAATLIASLASSNAATFLISNAVNGAGDPLNNVPADTLYALNDNTLMNGGIVSVGYFASSTTIANIDTIPELFALLGTFTPITSRVPGSFSNNLGGSFAGYADQVDLGAPFNGATSIGVITTAPLLNRQIYAIVTDAASLGSAVATSQFGLLSVGTLTSDFPFESNFVVSPVGGIIIGSTSTKTGDFAGDASEPGSIFNTYNLAAVPEPSTALLGTLGVLALLRRRRN